MSKKKAPRRAAIAAELKEIKARTGVLLSLRASLQQGVAQRRRQAPVWIKALELLRTSEEP